MKPIVNYGRNVSFTPRALEMPTSAAEIKAIVRRSKKLRVIGTGHSWSRGVVTEETLVSLDRMNRVVEVDRAALTVTVEAGIKLKHLIVELEARGLALANLGSIAEQSLAGAISTGTHGTGIGFACLASQVVALRLVDGEGRDRRLEKGDPDFDAVVVGLGAFGVVCEMTLRVVPCFQLHALTDLAKFDDVIANLDDLVRGHDHFKLWWLVPGDDVIVFQHRRTAEPRNDSDLKRWFNDDFLSVVVYRSLVALEALDRKRLVPLVNRVLGREVGKRHERICKSHVGFLTPDPPVHRETEWAFDYARAKELLPAYRRTLLSSGHTYNFIQEIRFTRGDDFWLSPARGRETIWLGMYNMDAPARWDDQLRQFEAFARAHDGRPHWGKEATFDSAYLAPHYPRWDAFRTLARRYDPDRKLVNDWLATTLGL